MAHGAKTDKQKIQSKRDVRFRLLAHFKKIYPQAYQLFASIINFSTFPVQVDKNGDHVENAGI